MNHYNKAAQAILDYNVKILPVLLDELAATLDCIENSPVGLSNGTLGASLGMVKKINPRDQALKKAHFKSNPGI